MTRNNDDLDLTAKEGEESSDLTAAEREMILKLFARGPAVELKNSVKNAARPRHVTRNVPSNRSFDEQ